MILQLNVSSYPSMANVPKKSTTRLAERIQKGMRERNFSSAGLARVVGVNEKTIRNLINGITKEFKQDKVLRDVSESLDIPIGELTQLLHEEETMVVSMKKCAYFNATIPASGWIETEPRENPDGFAVVPSDTPADAFCLRIFGQCMEPTFPSGSVVVFVPIRDGESSAEQYRDGRPSYFEHSDGKATFKRVFYEADKQRYRLEPINKEYKVLYVPEQMKARISRAIKLMMDIE